MAVELPALVAVRVAIPFAYSVAVVPKIEIKLVALLV